MEESEDYKISLITVLAYYKNFVVNVKEMFDSLQVPIIRDPPTTKKGIDIKNIVVPSGTIISVKCGPWIKGLDPKPSGQYRFFLEEPKNMKKDKTLPLGILSSEKSKKKDHVIMEYIGTYPENINKLHDRGQLIKMEKLTAKGTKKSSFPSQMTMNYAYKTGQNINMFIFKKNIKISGFQKEKYAIKMIKRIWKTHMLRDPAAITYFSTGLPSFVFESSMTNSTFETNYNFILAKVNTLMHKLKEHDDSLILNSDFEATIDNGVKITLRAIKPEDYAFNMIVWDTRKKEWDDTKCNELVTKSKTSEDDKKSTISLYNEKYVISTRYGVILKDTYNYLENILNTHKKELQIVKKENISKFTPKYL